MKNLNYKKILLVFLVLIMLTSLTGCSNSASYERPLGSYSAETNIFEWLIVWPFAWVMSTTGNLFNNSFGWGLILTTIIVRFIAYPIYAGSQSSMFKMQLAQPDMNRVQAKYAGRNDEASRRKMSAEMQAVYKKHNIKPLGCLLIVFQLPIFSGMYTVINRITVEGGSLALLNLNFLGFDLNSSLYDGGFKNQAFTFFLVVLVVGTMYLSQELAKRKPSYARNIPKKPVATQGMSESTMKMMMIIPLVFMGFIAAGNAGIALYWVVGNTFQLCQSILLRRKNERKHNEENGLNTASSSRKSKKDIIDV